MAATIWPDCAAGPKVCLFPAPCVSGHAFGAPSSVSSRRQVPRGSYGRYAGLWIWGLAGITRGSACGGRRGRIGRRRTQGLYCGNQHVNTEWSRWLADRSRCFGLRDGAGAAPRGRIQVWQRTVHGRIGNIPGAWGIGHAAGCVTVPCGFHGGRVGVQRGTRHDVEIRGTGGRWTDLRVRLP